MRCVLLLAFVLVLGFSRHETARAASPAWSPLAVMRVGNIDALDSDEGDLAAFMRLIRNDGRFTPPLRALIGPEIRNPTFLGLIYEAWIECAALIPERPGNIESVWIFPVDSRDEYMSQLENRGVSEYEGMDGVSTLRETGLDGTVRVWHLEWLPGNVAVFGSNRDAVTETRRLYAENRAARGLLAARGGQFLDPDIVVRFYPSHIVGWQNSESGIYWWRERLTLLSRDLLAYWRPGTARARLIQSQTERLIAWPRTLNSVELSVWLEPEGVEWRLEAAGEFSPAPVKSDLSLLRWLPERTALGFAVPSDRAWLQSRASEVGELLLAAAGGAVSTEARRTAGIFLDVLLAADPRQSAVAWVAPPATSPQLGGTSLLLMEWRHPGGLAQAKELLVDAIGGDSAISSVLTQMGVNASLTPVVDDPDSFYVTAGPVSSDAGAESSFDAVYTWRVDDGVMILAGGKGRVDPGARARILEYRNGLIDEILTERKVNPSGTKDARQAFLRMGPRGASFIGFFDPVSFIQLVLIEAADWRPRSPDQLEPQSVVMAREMLEYGTADAWSVSGEADPGSWRLDGGMSWQSLVRLSAALGITESIGMD